MTAIPESVPLQNELLMEMTSSSRSENIQKSKISDCGCQYVTTQIPGHLEFGLWPQVKSLTLRVLPNPSWRSTKMP